MRVLLADDHRLLIEGLSNLLTAHGIQVVGIARDGREAIQMAKALKPDLILMDIRMPHCDGLAATRQIKAHHPEQKIVILTTSMDEQDLFEAVKSGACGYLLKSMSGDAFIEALNGIEEDIPPFSPGLASRLLKEFARLAESPSNDLPPQTTPLPPSPAGPTTFPGLTERQSEVLRLVAAGLTYQQVGERLSLSERTIRYHMAEIMNRLHLNNRSQVLAYVGQFQPTPLDDYDPIS